MPSTHRENFRSGPVAETPLSGFEGDTLNPLIRTSLLAFAATAFVSATAQQPVLTHHVRHETETGAAKALGQLPASQTLRLTLTLPLRNQAELDQFLEDLYNPDS